MSLFLAHFILKFCQTFLASFLLEKEACIGSLEVRTLAQVLRRLLEMFQYVVNVAAGIDLADGGGAVW